jgi:quercetin dioxygenase-like cupin family protein
MFAERTKHGSQRDEPLAHYHAHEDETIYLPEGELTVYAGGEELHARRGETVTIPRGLEHSLRLDSTAVTYLLQFSPAGFECYFI